VVDRQLNYGRAALDRYFARLSNVRTALDVGVGTGSDLMALKQLFPEAKLYGVDFNDASLDKVSNMGIQPIRSNIERDRLPLADEHVDVVIANQVFEHLKEIFWSLHEICRVLSVGGHVVIGVPNLASLHNRLLLMLGRQPTCIKSVGAHVRGFTKQDFLHFVHTVSGGSLQLKGFAGSNFYPLPGRLTPPFAWAFPTAAVGIFFHFQKVESYQPLFIEHLKSGPFETNFYSGLRQGKISLDD
jgi:SAM-dependent methyltransferase